MTTETRGADRVRRRAAQAQAKVTAQAEVAALTSPNTPEKEAAIEANKKADVARFGTTARTRRQRKQAEHKAQGEAELLKIAAAPPTPLAKLTPGQQVDNLTARRMAKLQSEGERDYNREAAKAAGLAVLETLKGRPSRDRHTRQRRIAQHNARQAKLTAAAAQA